MDKKLYDKVMSGKADYNIGFRDFEKLIKDLGFSLKSKKGSHKTYSNASINERITILPEGSKAKSYNVSDLRDIIKAHGL